MVSIVIISIFIRKVIFSRLGDPSRFCAVYFCTSKPSFLPPNEVKKQKKANIVYYKTEVYFSLVSSNYPCLYIYDWGKSRRLFRLSLKKSHRFLVRLRVCVCVYVHCYSDSKQRTSMENI